MSRRALWSFAVAGLVISVVIVVVSRGPSVAAPDAPPPVVMPEPAMEVSPGVLPAPLASERVEPAALEPPAAASVESAPAVGASADDAEDQLDPRVDDLIAALEALWRDAPDSFHGRAPGLVIDHLDRIGGVTVTLIDELEPAIRERVLEAPVRGALVALWAGGASRDALLGLLDGDLEQRRGVWLGGASAWPGLPADGLRLVLADYLDYVRRPEPTPPLELVLQRVPDPELEAALMAELLQTADDHDGVLDRHLVTLALGTGLDVRDHVFETYVQLLFDESPLGRQVRLPVLFVLTRSPRERSRAVVDRYLGEAGNGDLAADLARLWAAEQGALEVDVVEMLGPLVDGDDPLAGLFAVGAFGQWLDAARAAGHEISAPDLQYAQDVIAEALDTQSDLSVRIGAVNTLAFKMSTGFTRMDALRKVLEGDDTYSLRFVAVEGLFGTAGELQAEAHAVLQAWVAQETDPKLKQHIEAKLAAANSEEG